MFITFLIYLVCCFTLTLEHPVDFINTKVKIICSETQFPCFDTDMTCVPSEHRCDGHIQCTSTAADEFHCATKLINQNLNLNTFNFDITSFLVNIQYIEQLILCIIAIIFLFFIHKT